MSMSDTIADMLTRIRNGQMSKLLYVDIPYSKHKESILQVLRDEGYIDSFTVNEVSPNILNLKAKLKYSSTGRAVISEISRFSRPGKRSYSSINVLKPHYNDMGIYILSTSKGVMSDREAKAKKVGGEIICKVF